MKKEDRKGRCKNGHPITRFGLVLLGHIVGVCPNCNHRYLYSSIPAMYVGDKRNSLGERFHVYSFLTILICYGCRKFITSISIACHPMDEHEKDWNNELADLLEVSPNETI